MFAYFLFFFFKQKTAYEMRISDWSSDVCSSDLHMIERFLRYAGIGGDGFEEIDTCLGRQQIGHRHLMRETGRRPLEGGGEIEDHLAVLPHHNASVGEAAPVEDRKSTRLNSSH